MFIRETMIFFALHKSLCHAVPPFGKVQKRLFVVASVPRSLTPNTGLRLGSPGTAALTPVAQTRCAFCRCRCRVGRTPRRILVANVVVSWSTVPVVQGRRQRRGRLPRQRRVCGSLRRRRYRWPCSDRRDRLASGFAVLWRTAAGRGVAGAVHLVHSRALEWAFGAGRVGLRAGVAARPRRVLVCGVGA